MAANKVVRFGPIALTNTLTANLINAAIASLTGPVNVPVSQPYVILKHIRIINKTGGGVSFSLWIGATNGNVAGTEFMGIGTSIAANAFAEWFGLLRLDAADFLVGGASANTALTFEAEGEIGFS